MVAYNDSPNRKILGAITPSLFRGKMRGVSKRGETRQYGSWLVDHGITEVEVMYEASESDGSHALESVWATGSLDVLIPPARTLADSGCSALVWPCTCASFIGGLKWSVEQTQGLTSATGLPATSTSLAIVAALGKLHANTVDILSPYPTSLTEKLVNFLGDADVKVADVASLGAADDSISQKMDLLQEAKKFSGRLFPRAHPLLIPDTAVFSLSVVPLLEEALGRPVVAANHATLWQSLILLREYRPLPNAGRLFSDE